MAASGLVAIAYTNREPAADLHTLLDYVRQNSESLGIDETRIGLWSSSGNVPLALSVLIHEAPGVSEVRCLCATATCWTSKGLPDVAEMAEDVWVCQPVRGKLG